MEILNLGDRLQSSVRPPSRIEFSLSGINIDKLRRAPKPLTGAVTWSLPPSYLEAISNTGFFKLWWNSSSLDVDRELFLFDEMNIASTSEIVYVPPGIDLGNGEICTNHLVPFAGEPNGEWAFCFDTSFKGNEYPVYYHHQDTPRARIKVTGAWDPSSPQEPDFVNFKSWYSWLVDALEKNRDPENLGRPHYDFIHFLQS